MASVETQELFEKLKDRMINIVNLANRLASFVSWLPMEIENNILVDSYTGDEISKAHHQWNPGFPINDSSRSCMIYATGGEGYGNWACSVGSGLYCSCQFPEKPTLFLRGLCKDSHIDQVYLPQNSPQDGELSYFGNSKTQARFVRDDNQWKIEVFLYNTSAISNEIGKRFMLGKQNWTIEGDSNKCHDGKPYKITLKLTGCQEGEFTCDDGQCVTIEERCNQVPDCRDESDERGCKLIILKDGFNKNIPPIKRGVNGSADATNVSISITLMKVVEIEETDHSIHLQFQISLQWRENRAKYLNLKHDSALNALLDDDIETLWLPLILYDNTDQKEVTRLGVEWEWMTSVTVSREGNFIRSGLDKVDEAEIFEGAENRLTMNQTYTWEFQCKYELQRYPFDTQVTYLNVGINLHFNFELRNVRLR